MNKTTMQASLTAFLAVCVVLAGCSAGGSGTGEKPAAGAAEGAKPAEKRGSITASIYDRGKVPPEEGTIEKNRWTEWINQHGPVDVKFVPIPRGESVQKLNTMFAAGDVPDVILEFSTPFRNQLYSQNQLLPLDDLIEQHSTEYKALLKQWPQLKKAGTKSDGKLYEFGRANGSRPQTVLFIRADWLKKLNLAIPQTTEELFAVAKAFTEQDPDGNGQKDTYGISLATGTDAVINNIFGEAGWTIENGTMIRPWDRWKSALEYKKRIFDAGLADKDFLTDKNGEKAKKDWITGKLGIFAFLNGINQTAGYPLYDSLKKNVPHAEVIPIALPKSPHGQFSTVLTNPIQMTTVLYRGTKDPAAAIKYMDFMVKKENWMTVYYGVEGTHWKTGANGCPEFIDREKHKKEVSYTEDFANYASRLTLGNCYEPEASIDMSKQVDREFLEMVKTARQNYQDPSRPYPGVTHPEHMPELPKDLIVINTNVTKLVDDIFAKSIVSGAAYPADKALQDAMADWEKSGGKQLEEFYAKWYAENKDKAFLLKDIYDMMTTYE